MFGRRKGKTEGEKEKAAKKGRGNTKSGGLWSNSDRSSRNKNARDQMKEDSRLLWDARQNVGKGGKKMDRKQYAAMRRKVGGTARDYFKDWVDVDGEYTDKGYVSSENASVTALPVLIAVVVAVLGAAGYVVAATS